MTARPWDVVAQVGVKVFAEANRRRSMMEHDRKEAVHLRVGRDNTHSDWQVKKPSQQVLDYPSPHSGCEGISGH